MQLVEVSGLVHRQRPPRGGEASLDLEVRPAPPRQGPHRGNAAAGDEQRTRAPALGRRHDEAALDRAQPGQPLELSADLLQRGEPVAQAGRVLEAMRRRELGEPPPQPRQRERRPLQLVHEQRARCKLRPPPTPQRTL
jgi:hypothetical protein